MRSRRILVLRIPSRSRETTACSEQSTDTISRKVVDLALGVATLFLKRHSYRNLSRARRARRELVCTLEVFALKRAVLISCTVWRLYFYFREFRELGCVRATKVLRLRPPKGIIDRNPVRTRFLGHIERYLPNVVHVYLSQQYYGMHFLKDRHASTVFTERRMLSLTGRRMLLHQVECYTYVEDCANHAEDFSV